MGKLPAFQFYPGDWMKDPNLRRCSKAAKGVWIDMLCLMFECPIRGVLADAGGSPWLDQEIAEAVGGPIGTNLECIAELLSKGVASRNTRGAIVSRRLVRDEENRQTTKERVKKHRGKSNGNVTDDVTRLKRSCTEDEVEDEVNKKNDPPENSDVTIQTIASLHPKFAKPLETERAIVEQLDRLGDQMGIRNALNYLLKQTQKYRESWQKWPKDKQDFSPESPRWFASRCYAEPEADWDKKAAGSSAVDESGGHFEGNVYVTAAGKRMPGYVPPPKPKAKVVD